jgi:uncharacterized protein YndB with AHSA1/START domain
MSTAQIYQLYIKASAEAIWDAIIKPEHTAMYFHGAQIVNDPQRHVSHGPDGSLWGDSPVLEWDPPKRLVHEWRSLYDPDLAAEAPSRVTWEIADQGNGVCKLTLTHDRLDASPKTAASVTGAGWMYVLSGLKTYAETGKALA